MVSGNKVGGILPVLVTQLKPVPLLQFLVMFLIQKELPSHLFKHR